MRPDAWNVIKEALKFLRITATVSAYAARGIVSRHFDPNQPVQPLDRAAGIASCGLSTLGNLIAL